MKTVQLSLILIFSIISTQLQAQAQTRDRHKEEVIEKQLQDIDPSLVSTFKAATLAMDSQKYKTADSLYSIVNAKAPTFDPMLRRRGAIQLSLGNTEAGIEFCKKAVEAEESAYNLFSLAEGYMILKDSTKLFDIQQLLKKAVSLPNGDDVDILATYAQICFQRNELEDAESAITIMKEKHPKNMLTHYYSAVLHAYQEEWREAKKEILKAQDAGLPQEDVDAFLDMGINTELLKINIAIYLGIIIGVWGLGLLALFLIGKLFSNSTLKAIENNSLETSAAKPGGWLRSGYKSLINIAGFYYYISLPIILVLVVSVTVGIVYLFLLIGRIPIYLVFLLIIGAIATIYSMIKSLLLKVEYTDPGRELTKEEAPLLYQLTDEVAQIMSTRPIEEIRITPLSDLAVYEKGSRKEKRNDEGKRILILGTAVLKDFKKGDFKAVLAHEYGHFTHRDTAGGEVALRVQNDITKYFIALINAEQNTIWNIAFHFLRLYDFIFRRISHGATRLQEVLADRIAVETSGATTFINGLTHVIKSNIEFGKYADIEIEDAIETKRPLSNLYELKGNLDATIKEELEQALNSKTTEDDTHPSPADRFRYIQGIKAPSVLEDATLVKELFQDWNALTAEMTQTIESRIERD